MSNENLAKKIVVDTLGEENDYLIRLMKRIINDELHDKPVSPRYSQINEKLTGQIEDARKDILVGNEDQKQQQLIINSILKEKIADRSEAEQNKRQKHMLAILTVVLPIVTNILQLIITQFASKSCQCPQP